MPYVPSEKTNPPAQDRKILDSVIEQVAQQSAAKISYNFFLIAEYKYVFIEIAMALRELCSQGTTVGRSLPQFLAQTIFDVGRQYEYQGAFLGELNYAITRFIQRVPQIKVALGDWKESDELRYWLYAATIEALTYAHAETIDWGIGVSGVFEDIKDEYKWKVNRSYEAAQIVKSGDCYDTPYYTRLVRVEDEERNHIGYLDILLKRSKETLNVDVLPLRLVVKKA
ncbi:MAG: hypothetical protein Q8R36_04220 [bacterium]|nr:hypothetical protein [bacterium]